MRTITRVALSAALVGLAACAPLPPPGAMFVAVGPPAYYQAEAIGVAPGPGYVFVRGYWEWGGAAYRWVPGRWEARPHPRARWEEGRWRRARGGWYWVPGRWR